METGASACQKEGEIKRGFASSSLSPFPSSGERVGKEVIIYRLCWLIQTFIVNAPNLFLAVCWL